MLLVPLLVKLLLLLRKHDGSLPCRQASNCWFERRCCWSSLSNIAVVAVVFLTWVLGVPVVQHLGVSASLAYDSNPTATQRHTWDVSCHCECDPCSLSAAQRLTQLAVKRWDIYVIVLRKPTQLYSCALCASHIASLECTTSRHAALALGRPYQSKSRHSGLRFHIHDVANCVNAERIVHNMGGDNAAEMAQRRTCAWASHGAGLKSD